ncbi:sigma-54-dependent transcriptional regulator [Desulfovibrio ferrophilus]|uniref:Fis family transcriptional regulator n=1 Tax=Desulfovibrio ferrophilus TaxID=241368 RepID=A0A2Z6AZX5_9BACT|nr:sigma-54 dependent transcriptional regulator [Desulfovibrio ferrophilus]BBD08794.1 Fis family transcriptional regulator [Desulfovibrio ferrophilus]
MSSKTILFLAKPQAITPLFAQCKEAGVEAGLAETIRGALDFIEKKKPGVVFAYAMLPGVKLEDLLIHGQDDSSFPPVVVFTDRGSSGEAQRLMELGAKDYWLEPLSWEKIQAVIPSDEAPVPANEPQATAPPAGTGVKIIGQDASVRRVLALSRQVAPSKASVLISGESGTGKEMFARYLHQNSNRANAPFVAINCAALPEHLLESELFGHEKGSFTGAINRKLGKFELASGGTILLDEITEMDMGLQAKLLRVLQEGELDRVGGVETVKVDVRVLATTNRDIETTVKNKEFRQDLYFRLNVIPLKLPALNERGDDIMLLAQFFVDHYSKEYGLPRLAFSDAARAWLMGYDWPGNVRELQNLMERAVLLAGAGPIEEQHFLLDGDNWPLFDEEELQDETPSPGAPAADEASLHNALGGRDLPLSEIERIAILKRLEQTEGNRTQAADLLGISVRTLRNKISDYKKRGLTVP